ncbi:MAG: ubiquinone biosynthesis protein UbiH [Methylocystaceae bacterium]|nr:ubiquinone biosynthesis protein UbiH [Methylocystaceae bacterium]NBT96214.1 ubiquinone biosynthesis protein UbiH [Methylocystaceae bacterium]
MRANRELTPQAHEKADILIAGAGSTGLAAALAFAKSDLSIKLIGRVPPPLPGRTVALFEASIRFLDALGALERVTAIGCPIEAIRMIDDTDQLLPVPPLTLSAREIDLPALGVNISNDDLVGILRDLVTTHPNIDFIDADIIDYELGVSSGIAVLNDQRRIEADFLIAADGRNSRARAVAGIDLKEWTYPQIALTAMVRHEFAHANMSTEYHTRSGPFTLVPLPALPNAPHRSSLVWLMNTEDARRRLAAPREELEFEIEDFAKSEFGVMRLESDIGQFRMGGMQVSQHGKGRLALVGETCHVFPPIGAQGLNLSLRDVADLEDCLASVDLRNEAELARALARYDRHRHADIGFRTSGVDILNRSLIIPYLPVDLFRGASFLAVSVLSPLRRAIIREGILPHFALPRMMRDPHQIKYV